MEIVKAFSDLQKIKNADTIYRIALLLQELKGCEDIPEAFFEDDFPENAAFISNFAAHAVQLFAAEEKLQRYHLEKFKDYDFRY